MSESKKILVLGGTGPLGICILRELLYRNHSTVAYARNPSKIPEDLASNPLLQIIKGEMDDKESLSTALSQTSTVISALGPVLSSPPATETQYAEYYSLLLSLMRQHHVRRIFALSTCSVYRPEDKFSILRSFMVGTVHLFFAKAYRTILNVADVFDRYHDDNDNDNDNDDDDDGGGSKQEGKGKGVVEWTLYRVSGIPGGADEESWKKDREDGKTYVGAVGGKGWTPWQRRGALARWLVDVAESGAPELVGKMPAVGRRSGS